MDINYLQIKKIKGKIILGVKIIKYTIILKSIFNKKDVKEKETAVRNVLTIKPKNILFILKILDLVFRKECLILNFLLFIKQI